MNKEEQFRRLSLGPSELKVLLALEYFADSKGVADPTMSILEEVTGYSRMQISRAVKTLIQENYIEVKRLKRLDGFNHRNVYQLLSNTDVTVSSAPQSHSNADVTSITNKALVIKIDKALDTTYLMEGEKKVVNRWKDDDEDLAGVGLIEEKTVQTKKPSKREPKTRHSRPIEDWTPADMATEFSYRVYQALPGIPGVVNTRSLWGALAKNRKQFGVTAVLEYELLEKYFADSRNLTSLKQAPAYAHAKFLTFITNNIQAVASDLGVEDQPEDIPIIEPVNKYVYASDGRRFDNSMPGRLALKEHEKRKAAN
jgi:DNA-binding transcriptional regulator GbsR (MarR family)